MSKDTKKPSDDGNVPPEDSTAGTPSVTPQSTTGAGVTASSMVHLPASEFAALLDRIKRLEAAGDRGRLTAYDTMNAKPVERFVKLSQITRDGATKVVMAWRMVRDNVYKGANGAWVEDQVVEVIFEDDTKLEMSLIDFYRKTQEKLHARIVNRTVDGQGRATFELDCDDGKVRVINETFVN